MDNVFLFPVSRQYGALDEAADEIVQALYGRNFAVEGVTVALGSYTNNSANYSYVEAITIPALSVELHFGRGQGLIDHNRVNTAALHTVGSPSFLLDIYEDYSGPVFYVYVGEDWDNDRDAFFHGIKVNSKLNRQPRTYLRYHGSADPEHGRHYTQRLNPYLAADNDLGREYSPGKGDAPFYRTQDVVQTFAALLHDSVLPFIESAPDALPAETDTSDYEGYAGSVTLDNFEAIAATLGRLLGGRSYLFDDGWGRGPRTSHFEGISTHRYSDSGSVNVSDSYGVWGFSTADYRDTHISLQPGRITINHFAPGGNPLSWTIDILDEV